MAVAFSKFKPSSVETILSSLSPTSVVLTEDELKKIVANKAVELFNLAMVVGLGTVSTAKHAVDEISELFHQGKLKNIAGIPPSKTTHDQTVSLGIPLSDPDSYPVIIWPSTVLTKLIRK